MVLGLRHLANVSVSKDQILALLILPPLVAFQVLDEELQLLEKLRCFNEPKRSYFIAVCGSVYQSLYKKSDAFLDRHLCMKRWLQAFAAVLLFLWIPFSEGYNGAIRRGADERAAKHRPIDSDKTRIRLRKTFLEAPSEADNFIYEPLVESVENPTIHLVELLPFDGSLWTDVYCKLHTVALSDGEKYEALSYVWGDPSERSMIQLDGRRLSVTTNLKLAFAHMRLTDTSRLLWIDAICINQGDLDERTAQVKLMRRIYECAWRTIVWLGESDDDSTVAFKTIGEIVTIDCASRQNESLLTSEDFIDHTESLEKFNEYQRLYDQERNKMYAVQRLLNRPWFSRIWVVQELGVSVDVLVQCGEQQISWEYFFYSFPRKLLGTSASVNVQDAKLMELQEMRAHWRSMKYIENRAVDDGKVDDGDGDDVEEDELEEDEVEEDEVEEDAGDVISNASNDFSDSNGGNDVSRCDHHMREGSCYIQEPKMEHSVEVETSAAAYEHDVTKQSTQTDCTTYQDRQHEHDKDQWYSKDDSNLENPEHDACSDEAPSEQDNSQEAEPPIDSSRAFPAKPHPTSSQSPLSINILLETYQPWHATDARDKAFALYGLTNSHLGALGFEVDYNKPAVQVFTSIAISITHALGDLSFLSQAGLCHASLPGLPSWVPDWSYTGPRAPSLHQLPGRHNPPTFTASGNANAAPSFAFIRNDSCLAVQAQIVDTVAHVTEELVSHIPQTYPAYTETPFQEAVQNARHIIAYQGILARWQNFATSTHRGSDDAFSVYWRTITVGGVRLSQGEYILLDEEACKHCFGTLLFKVLQLFHRYTTPTRLLRLLFEPLCVAIFCFPVLAWRSLPPGQLTFAHGRRLGRTGAGRLALLPMGCEERDVVALLEGLGVPVVLRGISGMEGEWSIVGECYVDGLMRGEGWVNRGGEMLLV